MIAYHIGNLGGVLKVSKNDKIMYLKPLFRYTCTIDLTMDFILLRENESDYAKLIECLKNETNLWRSCKYGNILLFSLTAHPTECKYRESTNALIIGYFFWIQTGKVTNILARR